MNFRGTLLRCFALLLALVGAMVSCQLGPESDSPSIIEPISTLSTETIQQPSMATNELATAAVVLPAARPTSEPSDKRKGEEQSISLVITNGIVIDGTGAVPMTDGFVAIQGNRIVAVGQAADFKIPDEAVVINAAGGTILPGIINSHSHQDLGAGTRRIMFLLDGVTSTCDMMIPMPSMHFLEEEGIQSGPAARGFKAGPIITAPGGYPGVMFGKHFSYEIQGGDEAETAVRDLHARGADYIKVALEPGIFGEPWPVLNLRELRFNCCDSPRT